MRKMQFQILASYLEWLTNWGLFGYVKLCKWVCLWCTTIVVINGTLQITEMMMMMMMPGLGLFYVQSPGYVIE